MQLKPTYMDYVNRRRKVYYFNFDETSNYRFNQHSPQIYKLNYIKPLSEYTWLRKVK